MIRISRLTDYGIVLMSYISAHSDRVHNATELAAGAHLPLPTVSKLLRLLARDGLLESHRGVKGGYNLARPAPQISVAQVIRALEGPIAVTACTTRAPSDCEHEPVCPVRGHWHKINLAIVTALDNVSLSDMATRPEPRYALPRAGNRAGDAATATQPEAARGSLAQGSLAQGSLE